MFDSVLGGSILAQIITVVLGLVILLAGRRLFWLVVAVAGFLGGLALVVQFLGDQQLGWIGLAIAVLAGILGAVLAVFLQRVAVAIAGFVLGGYGLAWLLSLFMVDIQQWLWLLIFLMGGIIGASLMMIVFDVGLIIVSSLAGAAIIVQAFPLAPWLQLVAFVVLVAIGFIFQSSMANRATAGPPSEVG